MAARIIFSEVDEVGGSGVNFTTIDEDTSGYFLDTYRPTFLRASLYMNVNQDKYVKSTNTEIFYPFRLLYFYRRDDDGILNEEERSVGYMRNLIDFAGKTNLQRRTYGEYQTFDYSGRYAQFEYMIQYWLKGYTSISNIGGNYTEDTNGLYYDITNHTIEGLDTSSGYISAPEVNVYFPEETQNYFITKYPVIEANMNTTGDEIEDFTTIEEAEFLSDSNDGFVHIEEDGKTKFPTFEYHVDLIDYLKDTYGYDSVRMIPVDMVEYNIAFSQNDTPINFILYSIFIEGTTGTEEKDVKLLLRLKSFDDGLRNGNIINDELYNENYLYIKENINTYDFDTDANFSTDSINETFPLEKYTGIDIALIDTSFESIEDVFDINSSSGKIQGIKFKNVYLTDPSNPYTNIIYYVFFDGDNKLKYCQLNSEIIKRIDSFVINSGGLTSPDVGTFDLQDFSLLDENNKGNGFSGTITTNGSGITAIDIEENGLDFKDDKLTAIKFNDVWYLDFENSFDIDIDCNTKILRFNPVVESIDLLFEGLVYDDENTKFIETFDLNSSPYLKIHTDKRTFVINIFTKELIFDSPKFTKSFINNFTFKELGYNFKIINPLVGNAEYYYINDYDEKGEEFIDIIENGKIVINKIKVGINETEENDTFVYNITDIPQDTYKIKLQLENLTELPLSDDDIPEDPDSYIKLTYLDMERTIDLINQVNYETIINITDLPFYIDINLNENEKRLYKQIRMKVFYLKEN